MTAAQSLVLQAAFRTVDELRLVLQELHDWGVPSAQIEVRSSSPIEKPLPLERKRSWVLLYALIGALLGGSAAFWLSTHSALAYPLPTGGMDIIAGPPVAIVTYEGTALGLILCTVFGVLFEGRLLRPKKPGALDGHLSRGHIVLNLLGVDGEALPKAVALCQEHALEVHQPRTRVEESRIGGEDEEASEGLQRPGL